jgi:hypothetical protein
VATGMILLTLVEVGLWVGLARACERGRNGARIVGTVLFGLYTFGTLGVLGNSHSGIAVTKLLTVVSWLIACAAVVFLWQPASSAFFRNRR